MGFITEWGRIAGIAGLALGVFLVLFREIIRKNIFSTLTKKQSYTIIIVFMILVWFLSIFSITQYYFNQPKSMQLTVYVHGPEGKQDIVLENIGKLIVDFGNDRRTPVIGQNGRTNFGEIPQKLIGTEIENSLDAPRYELVNPNKQYNMDGKPIYIAVKKDGSLRKISGIVKNRDGSIFLNDALVMIGNDTTHIIELQHR